MAKKIDSGASQAKGKALVAELRLKYINDFMNLWQQFYKQLDQGAKAKHVTDEQDIEFLKTKAHILQLVQVLYESLGDEVSFRNRVISICEHLPAMHFLPDESPVLLGDLRTQWNEVLIAATRLAGGLRDAAED